jgi:hypothetical protein
MAFKTGDDWAKAAEDRRTRRNPRKSVDTMISRIALPV